MNTQVTGQQSPGKNKRLLRPSYIILAVSLAVYLALLAYASRRDSKAYEASLPQPWLKTWVEDLRAYYMKARPARFPADLTELDRGVWMPARAAGSPAPVFSDNNHSYVYENYRYVYFPAPGRPDVCTVLAYPLGPRRFEPGVKSFFIILTPNAITRWEGRALADEDVEKMKPAVPTLQQLQAWGLVQVLEPNHATKQSPR